MEFSDLIYDRFSVREFSDRKVDRETIDKILRAGQAAPTACNFQPQRIFVIESEEALASPMVRIRTRLFCFAALICCVILAPNTTVCVVRLPCI